MRFIDQLRIRQAIALIVIIPVLVGVFATSWLARQAQDRRDLAQAELVDLETLIMARDVQSGVEGELNYYTGWMAADDMTGFATRGASVTLIRGALADSVSAVTDTAFDESRQADLPAEFTASLRELEDIVTFARDAFERNDAAGIAAATVAIEAPIDVLDTLGDEVLQRRGLKWLAVDQQSTFSATVGEEILATMTALLAGVPADDNRQQYAVLVDRSDSALEVLLDASTGDQADRIDEAFRATLFFQEMRPRVLDPNIVEPMTLTEILQGSADILPFVEEMRIIRGESAAELEQAASIEADRAETQQRLMIALAISLVLVPAALVVVVGGRLSHRVRLLADAAERLSSGELGVRVDEIGGTDEIAVLANAFNEVSGTIAASHEQISALADGRTNDAVFETELPGIVGHTLRLALRRLGNATAELAHQASHDKLTGLLDRRGLQHGIDAADRKVPWSVILVDLDGFKLVNDAFGHSAGDAVLEATARRLRAAVRTEDLVARLGGDEFVLAVDATAIDGFSIEATIERIITSVARPVDWHHEQLQVTCSVGWTQFRNDEMFGDALHRADQAMYEAKRTGKARALFA